MTIEIFHEELGVIARSSTGISSIRKKIIDLAMRGRLVSQDSTDEPASLLLERITVEKQRLVKEKKIRMKKPILPTEVDQELFEIPANWVWSYLGNIGNIFTGNSMSKVKKDDKYSKVVDGRPYIMTPNIGYGCDIESYDTGFKVPFDDDSYRVARPETPLVCKEGGSAGKKVGFSKQEICFGNKLIALETYADFSPSFVFYFFQSQIFYSQFSENMTGIIGGISLGSFNEITIPSPPIAEQHRIVDKLNDLMKMLDRLEEGLNKTDSDRVAFRNSTLSALVCADDTNSLEKAWGRTSEYLDDMIAYPDDVVPLRQAILQLAMCGRLAPQNTDDEAASDLLKRSYNLPIGYKRKRKIVKKTPVKTPENLFDAIPESWAHVSIQNLYDQNIIIDFADGNHGSLYPRKYEFGEDGITFVSAKNLSGGRVTWSECNRLNEKKAKQLTKGWSQGGDVLLTHNATVGRVARVELGVERFLLGTSVTYYRLNEEALDRKFFSIVLMSPIWQSQLEAIMQQTTRNQVSIQKQAHFRIPIPPLAEQHRIVAKVDAMMELCDNLELRLANMKIEREALSAANYW